MVTLNKLFSWRIKENCQKQNLHLKLVNKSQVVSVDLSFPKCKMAAQGKENTGENLERKEIFLRIRYNLFILQ